MEEKSGKKEIADEGPTFFQTSVDIGAERGPHQLNLQLHLNEKSDERKKKEEKVRVHLPGTTKPELVPASVLTNEWIALQSPKSKKEASWLWKRCAIFERARIGRSLA